METIICPSCRSSNAIGVKYCQSCGTSLATKCRRCGAPNSLGVVFCGNCGVQLSEASFGIPSDEASKWRDAFGSLGWFQEFGPRTKKILPQLRPPLDTSKEQLMLVSYGSGSNYIKNVQIDNMYLRRNYFGLIATSWRLILLDTDQLKYYSFPFEDIASVEKPSGGGLMKDTKYVIQTKGGHFIGILIHLDAPGLLGVLAGFSGPGVASDVLNHKRRAEEIIKFLNMFFTRIVPD